jgi:hypothetical protein
MQNLIQRVTQNIIETPINLEQLEKEKKITPEESIVLSNIHNSIVTLMSKLNEGDLLLIYSSLKDIEYKDKSLSNIYKEVIEKLDALIVKNPNVETIKHLNIIKTNLNDIWQTTSKDNFYMFILASKIILNNLFNLKKNNNNNINIEIEQKNVDIAKLKLDIANLQYKQHKLDEIEKLKNIKNLENKENKEKQETQEGGYTVNYYNKYIKYKLKYLNLLKNK